MSTMELAAIEYDIAEDAASVAFFRDASNFKRELVASIRIEFVDISFYAKQHLQKKPPLLECGVVIVGTRIDKFLIPTGRTRMAGNGSVAVKYYDVSKPIKEQEIEKYERVGIRLPTGVFTYAFFEAQYLARSEDPRRGALFLIDPRMIVVSYPMTKCQKKEFQTFGGKKVLYFDVLDAPNLQERKEEIRRCRQRGDEQKRIYEEADRKWEEEMQERLARKAIEDSEKPKLSKKAKQKARQAQKRAKDMRPSKDSEITEARDEEEERLHKQKQAESRARAEEEQRLERESEAAKRKAQTAEARRLAEAQAASEAARMSRVKSLLQKVQSSLQPFQAATKLEGDGAPDCDSSDAESSSSRKRAAGSSDRKDG